jgi:hypothetical protein
MKHTLLLVLILLVGLGANAQTNLLTFSTTNAKKDAAVDLSDQFLDVQVPIVITNVSKDTLRLRWRRVEVTRPSKWETRVCDVNDCYDQIVSSNIDSRLGLNAPLKIAPNAKSNLILYFLPFGAAGSGKFSIQLMLTSKPDSVIATLNYEATIRNLSTSTRDLKAESLQIFPNPSSDYFQVKNGSEVEFIELYNVIGRKVRSYTAEADANYRLNGLPDGIYLAALLNKKKGVIRTLRLQKKSERP